MANKTIGLGLGLILVALVATFTWCFSEEFGSAAIRNSIRLSLCFYFLAQLLTIQNRNYAIPTRSEHVGLAGWLWIWGMLAYVSHVYFAFNYSYSWSHQLAVESTKRQSGFGNGIFVSYAFTLLWMIDATWLWLSPRSYSVRSETLSTAIQVVMLFVTFNGAVVFASGATRWFSATAFGLLAWQWRMSQKTLRESSPHKTGGSP